MGLVLHADMWILTVSFGVGTLILIALFIYFAFIKNKIRSKTALSWDLNSIIFRGIVLLQIFVILFVDIPYIKTDITAETVNSFLSTGHVYAENPLTGGAPAMPSRLKILCLPTLYTFICKIFSAEAVTVVWRAVPVAIIILSYIVFYDLSRTLFIKKESRTLFMLSLSVLLFVGCYTYGMEGFLLLFAGWQGNSIRAMILMPATLNFAIKKQWLFCVVFILTEAMTVWTLYGAGFCLLETILIFLIGFITEKITNKKPEVRYE